MKCQQLLDELNRLDKIEGFEFPNNVTLSDNTLVNNGRNFVYCEIIHLDICFARKRAGLHNPEHEVVISFDKLKSYYQIIKKTAKNKKNEGTI